MQRIRKLVAIAVLGLCSVYGPSQQLDAAAATTLTASDGWVRESPPGVMTTGGYLTLHNPSDQPLTVVSIEAKSVARQSELHVSETTSGTTSMRHLAQLVVPPHATVGMQPGATHIMLMGLKAPLTRGSSVPVTLHLLDGSSLDSTLVVRAP